MVNDPVINKNNFTISEWLFTTKPGLFGLVGGWANPTGVALFLILLVMFICSQSFVRRGGCFEVLYHFPSLVLHYSKLSKGVLLDSLNVRSFLDIANSSRT